jgi:hypothetical protein
MVVAGLNPGPAAIEARRLSAPDCPAGCGSSIVTVYATTLIITKGVEQDLFRQLTF